MAYPAAVVANFFISKASQCGQELTPMKLIKLVYLAHGWCLGLEGTPLIDESVVAWQFGPVVESLYQEFKRFGNEQITTFADDHERAMEALGQDKISLAILERVWEVYGGYSAVQLSNLTHKPGSPWDIAWNKEQGKNSRNHCIQNTLIRDYYAKQAEKRQ
jgi:uncharacterized phage-associated protein